MRPRAGCRAALLARQASRPCVRVPHR